MPLAILFDCSNLLNIRLGTGFCTRFKLSLYSSSLKLFTGLSSRGWRNWYFAERVVYLYATMTEREHRGVPSVLGLCQSLLSNYTKCQSNLNIVKRELADLPLRSHLIITFTLMPSYVDRELGVERFQEKYHEWNVCPKRAILSSSFWVWVILRMPLKIFILTTLQTLRKV